MKYTVTYDDGKSKIVGKFSCPTRLPQEGDVYVTKIPFGTAARVIYRVGDRFAVMGRTSQAPHNRVSSLGNLMILCKVTTSVWTEFDAAVAEGRIELLAPCVDSDRLAEIHAVLDKIKLRSPQSA